LFIGYPGWSQLILVPIWINLLGSKAPHHLHEAEVFIVLEEFLVYLFTGSLFKQDFLNQLFGCLFVFRSYIREHFLLLFYLQIEHFLQVIMWVIFLLFLFLTFLFLLLLNLSDILMNLQGLNLLNEFLLGCFNFS